MLGKCEHRHHGLRNRRRIGRYRGLSPDGARKLCLKLAVRAADGVDLQLEKRTQRDEAVRSKQRTPKAFLDDRYEPWARTQLNSAVFQLAPLRSDFREWPDRPMTKLNAFVVEGMRHRWKKAGMQPRSISRDIQLLQSVLSRAVEWGVPTKLPRLDRSTSWEDPYRHSLPRFTWTCFAVDNTAS